MKSFIYAVSAAVLLASPLASFAQEQAPLTRAQVKAELHQMQQAGLGNPGVNNVENIDNLQAAQAKVNTENMALASNSNGANDSGSGVSGSSQSSAPRLNRAAPTVDNPNSIYFGR
jgi:hypothetical protein